MIYRIHHSASQRRLLRQVLEARITTLERRPGESPQKESELEHLREQMHTILYGADTLCTEAQYALVLSAVKDAADEAWLCSDVRHRAYMLALLRAVRMAESHSVQPVAHKKAMGRTLQDILDAQANLRQAKALFTLNTTSP